jgi:SlyX protein
MNTEQAIEQIEMKLAFLENANHELSEVVYRQQQEIDLLNRKLLALANKLQEQHTEGSEWTAEQEKPPHY